MLPRSSTTRNISYCESSAGIATCDRTFAPATAAPRAFHPNPKTPLCCLPAPLPRLVPFSPQPPFVLSHRLLRCGLCIPDAITGRALRPALLPHASRNVFPPFHQNRQPTQQAERRCHPRQHVRPRADHGVRIRRQLTHQRHRPPRQRQLQPQVAEAQALHRRQQPPAPARRHQRLPPPRPHPRVPSPTGMSRLHPQPAQQIPPPSPPTNQNPQPPPHHPSHRQRLNIH